MKQRLWVWLVPVLLVSLALGARGLDSDGYWIDEVWSLYTAGAGQYGPLDFAGVWQRVSTEDAWQAPGFYLLLNVWTRLVGTSEAATRTLAWLFGALAVAAVYRAGRDLHSPLVGLAAALTLAVSTYLLTFFHELRGYTLYLFLTATALWSYWRTTG